MSNVTNEELVSEGLKMLDSALQNFMEVKDCEHGKALANVTHGLFVLGEMIYNSYKK